VKYAVLAVKLAISGAIVWLLVTRVDLAPIGAFLKSQRGLSALAACIAILLVQAVLAAVRLRWIMRLLGAPLPAHLGFSIWMIGLLISQTLVTFIAGDAARIWQLIVRGYKRRLAGSAIFLERALGFAVLMAMVLPCIPYLLSHDADGAARVGLTTLAALCLLGVVGFILSGFVNRVVTQLAPRLHAKRITSAIIDVTSAARHLGAAWGLTTGIVGLSVAMHLCNAAAFYVLGRAVDVPLDLLTVVAVALPVMLIALLPIAFAGWGVREGVAVVGFGLFAVPAQDAVTISVAFGVALLIASLPGGIYLWLGKRLAANAGTPAPSIQPHPSSP
jgi:uncharacterized membrane protein YbhN (UPF0104 family)